MKRTFVEVTCESCNEKRKEESYKMPHEWVELTVSRANVTGYAQGEAIHFCNECWTAGKPPKSDGIPLLVRRLFSWAFEKEERIHGASVATSLADALEISRGQWIHSVNALQCCRALDRAGRHLPPVKNEFLTWPEETGST